MYLRRRICAGTDAGKPNGFLRPFARKFANIRRYMIFFSPKRSAKTSMSVWKCPISAPSVVTTFPDRLGAYVRTDTPLHQTVDTVKVYIIKIIYIGTLYYVSYLLIITRRYAVFSIYFVNYYSTVCKSRFITKHHILSKIQKQHYITLNLKITNDILF